MNAPTISARRPFRTCGWTGGARRTSRRCVAGRLDRDLVARRETVSERPQPLRRRRDLAGLAHLTVLPDRDLRELAMHIESEAPARHLLTSNRRRTWRETGGQTTPTDSRSRRIRASR